MWVACPTCKGTRYKKTSLFDTYMVGTEQTGGIKGDVPTVAKYVDLPLSVVDTLSQRESYYLEESYKMIGLGSLISPILRLTTGSETNTNNYLISVSA